MNCKPGDIAYIIASDFPANIGRVVEVTDHGFMCELGWVWTARSREPLAGYWNGTLIVDTDTTIGCLDSELRPISGVPVDEEVLDEVTA